MLFAKVTFKLLLYNINLSRVNAISIITIVFLYLHTYLLIKIYLYNLKLIIIIRYLNAYKIDYRKLLKFFLIKIIL